MITYKQIAHEKATQLRRVRNSFNRLELELERASKYDDPARIIACMREAIAAEREVLES